MNKRKRSSEGILENKRERRIPDSPRATETRSDTTMATKEGDAKFIKGFIACLKNGEVLGLLPDAFSGNVDKKLELTRNKITDLHLDNIERDTRTAKTENS